MTHPRVLLLGEDNPLSAEPEYALYDSPEGCSGWRLRRIFGLSSDDYLALDRTNLCTPIWNAQLARDRAATLTAPSSPFRVIVALGAKVRGALARALTGGSFNAWQVWRDDRGTRRAASPCEAPDLAPLTVVCLPHPSGRCTVWNRVARVHEARGILREVAPHIPWGLVEGDYYATVRR